MSAAHDSLTHVCMADGKPLCRNAEPQDKYAPMHIRKNVESYLDRVVTCQVCFDRASNLLHRILGTRRIRRE